MAVTQREASSCLDSPWLESYNSLASGSDGLRVELDERCSPWAGRLGRRIFGRDSPKCGGRVVGLPLHWPSDSLPW